MNFRAGAARVDITPPIGVDLTGFLLREGASVGVHSPLRASALFLDDGNAPCLIVTCSVLGFAASMVAVLRAAIEAATGIAAARIAICASHTHSGPTSMMLRDCSRFDTAWLASLPARLSEAARAAMNHAQPATLAAGTISIDHLSVNRRRADGPRDTDLHLLRVASTQGETIAALVVFACHPLATGQDSRFISADFPAALTTRIEAQHGGIALFANGACGDIDPAGRAQPTVQACLERAERIGHELAAAALAIWNDLEPLSPAALSVASAQLALPLLPLPASNEFLEIARECDAPATLARVEAMNRVQSVKLGWAIEMALRSQAGTLASHVAAEVQIFRCGDWALACVPGELFCALGMEIKKRAPRHTFVATYANGNIGYIPARNEYTRGGYELEAYRYYDYPAALAPQAGEMIVAAARDLLQKYA